jgi:hypothetical protein
MSRKRASLTSLGGSDEGRVRRVILCDRTAKPYWASEKVRRNNTAVQHLAARWVDSREEIEPAGAPSMSSHTPKGSLCRVTRYPWKCCSAVSDGLTGSFIKADWEGELLAWGMRHPLYRRLQQLEEASARALEHHEWRDKEAAEGQDLTE